MRHAVFATLLGSTLMIGSGSAAASGAMSATALGKRYSAFLVETSYAFGEDPPPAQSYLDSQLASMRQQLATIMPTIDSWIALEERSAAIAPVDVGLKTAMVESPPGTQRSGKLSRPAFVALPPCATGSSNLALVVSLALPNLPSPQERAKLGERMCAAVKKANASPPTATPFVVMAPLQKNEPAMRHALESTFITPRVGADALAKAREAFFALARAATEKALQRYVHDHPGTSLVAPHMPSSQTVRFSMFTAIGTYDLFLGIAGAKGSHEKVDVGVKDAIYADWQAAGLPTQTELETLLK